MSRNEDASEMEKLIRVAFIDNMIVRLHEHHALVLDEALSVGRLANQATEDYRQMTVVQEDQPACERDQLQTLHRLVTSSRGSERPAAAHLLAQCRNGHGNRAQGDRKRHQIICCRV